MESLCDDAVIGLNFFIMETTYTKIFTDSEIIVSVLVGLLEEAGIATLVKNQVESARLGGFAVPFDTVSVFVLNTTADAAQVIVDTYRKEIAK